MEENHLVPEYQLNFTDFPKSDTVQIGMVEINQGYARINLRYKKESYHLILHLQSKTPKYSMKLSGENNLTGDFPKHLNDDTYFTIIRNQEGSEEKNPKIVLSTLNTGTN